MISRQAKGVQVDGIRREADMVLLAAGAWSYDIDGVPKVARPPVRPLKGQVIALQMEQRAPIVDRVIWGPGIYLVPRRDGTLWVGFRPTSRDDAPILGPTPVEGLVVATGHHRNGVLLAPVTIDAVSAFMLDGTVTESVEPFGIGRFGAATTGKQE